MKLKIFFSVLLLTLMFESAFSEGRIYGGYQINITKAPYMAHVITARNEVIPGQSLEVENCGGSILRRNLILTAGHCECE